MTVGEVVLAYNLPKGPEELKLSRQAYTKIFLGEISKWNDPIIAKIPSSSLKTPRKNTPSSIYVASLVKETER